MLREIGMIKLGERSIRKFFEHPTRTYAAALAYRGLFGLFPFVLILVVLAGALGLANFLDRAIDQVNAESSPYVPQQLEPTIERGKEQLQPLQSMIEQAQKQAGGALLFFGVALALWSTSALAKTVTEAFNAAYEVPETRRWWKVSALSLAFGPVLALMVMVSVGLMLIGPQLVERMAELVGLDNVFVLLWGWLRFPVALALLAVVLSIVYRFGPNVEQRFRSVGVGAALAVVLWVISSVGFSFYLANFADYGVTYGSLGAAVGLLFYLYLCASVVLLGAEVNAAIHHASSGGRMEAERFRIAGTVILSTAVFVIVSFLVGLSVQGWAGGLLSGVLIGVICGLGAALAVGVVSTAVRRLGERSRQRLSDENERSGSETDREAR